MSKSITAAVDYDLSAIYKATALTLLTMFVYALLTPYAYATSTPMGDVLCNIVDMIEGNLGQGLATLGIIVVGVGASIGKVSWGLAITVAVGIAVMLQAKTILPLVISTGGGCP